MQEQEKLIQSSVKGKAHNVTKRSLGVTNDRQAGIRM